MEEKAKYLLTMAEVELKAGNYDKALGYMEEGRTEDPGFIDWDLYEIYLWQVQEDYYKVAELCSSYYDRDDKNVKVLEIWQEACYNLEWYKDVVGIGYAAIDLKTDNPFVYERIADAYECYGQYHDAIEVLEPVADQMPEFYGRLQSLYYNLTDEDGHHGIDEGKKAIEYANKFRENFDFDWRMEYRDIDMKIYISDFDGAIKTADEAIKKLSISDIEREEGMPDPKMVFSWLKGRAMLLNRKDPFSLEFDSTRLDESYLYLKDTFDKAVEIKDFDMIMCILESMNVYWMYTEKYDEGIEIINNLFSYYKNSDTDTEELNEMLSRFAIRNKNYEEAKKYKLKSIGIIDLGTFKDAITEKDVTADNLEEFKSININEEVDRVERVLNSLILEPELYTEKERNNAINNLLTFIEKVIELNREDIDAMIPITASAINFGPSITDDYQRLYNIVNSKYMKKMYSNAKQKYRTMNNRNLMRICYFLGKKNESKAYAKNYLADLNEKPICHDKGITFEEAIKLPRYSNRIDIAALGTAYLYMGRIEDAKNMLILMMLNPVCWFCKKCGCLEYYLLKSEIDIVEGNIEEARHFLDEVEKTEWNGHEEIAASLKKYLDSIGA